MGQEANTHHLSDSEAEYLVRIDRLVAEGEKLQRFGSFEVDSLLKAGYSLSLIEELANGGFEMTQDNAMNLEKKLRGENHGRLTTRPITLTEEDLRRYGVRAENDADHR